MSISKHVDDHMLADRHCFLVFHLNRYGSPPGVAISLLPLWFPARSCDISVTLVVPLGVLCNTGI